MMRPLTDRDVQAILTLLDDDDADVVRAVREKLLAMGRETVVRVRAAADPEQRESLDRLLRRLEEPPLDVQFRRLARTPDGDVDLEEGVFVIARVGHPRVDVEGCVEQLDCMAAEVAPRTAPDDHPIRAIRTLNAYLFEELGFRGGPLADSDNNFVNRVLERRVGIPITLSVVYLLVGWRLQLPLFGVGMPGHFIVKYQSDRHEVFVDPFSRGRVITRNVCQEIVSRRGFPFEEGHLDAASSRDILVRMMNNLIRNVYLPAGDEGEARRLVEYIQIVQGTP